MKFAEGDMVEVKLADGLRVAGTIVSKKPKSQYLVKYSDGSTSEHHERNLLPSERNELSPPLGVRKARKGSPSRAITPPRSKSPSRNRSPGRPKSPGRTKSPSRKTKQSPSPSREKSTRKKSPSRVMKLMVEKLDDTSLVERVSAERQEISFPRRRRAVEHEGSSPNKEINGSGDANSLKSNKAETSLNSSKVLHLKPDYESSVVEPEEKSLKYDGKIKTEFGGWPGALISMIIFPAGIFSLIHMCTKSSCDFHHFQKISLKPETYFNKDVAILTFAYIAAMYLLSLIPFVGKSVSSPNVTRDGKKHYKMNGLFSLIVIIGAIVGLEKYVNYPILKTIIQNYMQFAILSMVIGLVLTIIMYIHSRYRPVSELNIHAVTGNFIYDMYMGRTTSPRIFGFDIKLITLRASLIAVVLINTAFVVKGIEKAIQAAATETHKPTFFDITEYWNMDLSLLLTAGVMVGLYSFDHLLFESHILTTFEYMYEGFGFMLCMGYCLFPFMTTLITKFAFEHGIHWQLWQLVVVWMFYLPAIIMYRVINAQKNAFRSNPYNPAVAHLESIPTSQGKKLLVSGYWGIVRHPNYLVDLIQHLCLYSLTPCNPPAVMPIASIFFILYRMYRDEKRCQAKYGVAWDRYCHRVRYHLIPKVF